MIKLGSNSIGKLYLGSNKIGKAYLGSNLVYQTGSGPSPSTMVPYIRGGANGAYIDTGITADNTTRVIVWARNFNPGGSEYTWLFGARDSYGTSGMYGVTLATNDKTGRALFANGGTTYTNADFWNYISNYHKYELNSTGLYVDDVQVSAQAATTFTGSYNLYLFNDNDGGTPEQQSKMPVDICACKIYKNNVLVRDYSPVNSPSFGLYDAVSNTVFTNAGSGSFTYGSFNPDAYTPLEYIEGNGDSYFDSGVTAGYATQIISKFRFTTNTANVTLIGYRGSNDWCEFDINYGSTIKMYYRLASAETWSALYNATSSNFLNQDIVLVKGTTNSASLYKNATQIGTTVSPSSSSSYVSSGNLCVAALNLGSSYAQPFTGRIYYVGIGSSRSFVPAKKNGVAGMYDTYNDVFYQSESGTPFIEGPTL